MNRQADALKKISATSAAFLVGALLGVALSSPVAAGTAASAQDSAVVVQMRQELNSLRLELGNRISTIEIDMDRLERHVVDTQNRLLPMENELRQLRLAAPVTPQSRTIAGTDRAIAIDTADGAELRLYDARGNLRVVLAASSPKGEIVLYDADGEVTFQR